MAVVESANKGGQEEAKEFDHPRQDRRSSPPRHGRRDFCPPTGLAKPETFDFLGFTHICGTTRAGKFQVLRKTISKRRRNKLRELKQELKRRRHLPIPEQGKWLRSVVLGHLRYYAVPGNLEAASDFIHELRRLWQKTLSRRSQKTRMTWPRFTRLAAHWLPSVRNMHPYPERRFAATHPR